MIQVYDLSRYTSENAQVNLLMYMLLCNHVCNVIPQAFPSLWQVDISLNQNCMQLVAAYHEPCYF